MQPDVGIDAEPPVAVPDIADRHADPQLATARLSPGGVNHARPDHTQLELADAALHAEQQPVVRPTGVVDAIKVDRTGLDQTAQFKQMMPVPAIARQPRGIKAQHCANLARAQGGDELLEPGPGHHATRGTPELVVDDLDGPEPVAPGDVDQLVLATSALGVEVDLGLVDWRT